MFAENGEAASKSYGEDTSLVRFFNLFLTGIDSICFRFLLHCTLFFLDVLS